MKFVIAFLSIVLGCALALPQTTSSQPPKTKEPQQKQPNQDDATIRIETELVQVEAIVTDKSGKLVRDLKREDFELKEDGKPQELSHFSVGTSTRPARWITTESKTNPKEAATTTPTTTPTTTLEAGTGRYIVLAIDDLHLAFGNLVYARQALLKFVDQQLTPDDQVALITTSGQLGLHQQFTNNREILKRAINRLSFAERRVAINTSGVPRLTPYQAELIENNIPDALALAVNEIMAKNPGTTRQMAESEARSKARMIVSENTSLTRATLGTIENILRGLRGLPGRKTMVMLSDGFLLGGFSQGALYDVRRITDAATRSGVVIYALDTRGLIAMPEAFDASQPGFGNEQPPGARMSIESSAMEANRDGLNALSRDTGGFPIFNNNDLSLGLQKIAEDTEVYYLLAFEPTVSYRDGRFRKLEVRVKNHPEYKVRSSKGYFAPDDKATVKAAEKEEKERAKLEEERAKNPDKAAKKELSARIDLLRDAMNSLYPLREIPVALSASFVDTGKGEGYAHLLAHFDVANVKFEKANDRYNAALEVLVGIYDEKGKSVDTFSQKLALALKPATYERTLKSGFLFHRQIKLAPGFYQVRMVVVKEFPRQAGSSSEWVEIGDLSKKQLALSSIFLAADNEVLFAALPQNEKVEEEKKIEDQQVVPMPSQISHRFKRNSKFDFTVFAYNAKMDANGKTDLAIQTQLYTTGNKLLLATPLTKIEMAAENKTAPFAPYAARLSLDKFAPGTYELRLVVVDRVANINAKRSVSFVIE
ncbi:MAG: VWA domain-containing protein [Blastocatellia bacterium]|nr:VWA domain-containing protein [Blastocatellia bacterium]